MKKGTILIIVENLPVPHDRRVWQEALTLKENGFGVTVICPKGKGYTKKYENLEGIHIYRHPLPIEARKAWQYIFEYSIAFFWESILALKVYKKHGFDVIQACNPPDIIVFVALFYKFFFRKGFIFDHHDGNPEIWLAKGGEKNLVYRTLLFLEKITFKNASVSLAVNEPYKDLAINRGEMNPEDVFVVRNSPKLSQYYAAMSAFETVRDKKQNNKQMIGYLGVMGKQDSVDRLLESIKYIIIDKNRKDLGFLLMGAGPELEHLKIKANKYGITDYIHFTGWISGDDYYKFMSSCDFYVNADEVSEYNNHCSPNKVYEYMMFGKPFVQFRMKENSYLAGDCALYAENNDYTELAEKIIELADNPEKRLIMGEEANKRFTEMFTWEKSARNLVAAYDHYFRKSLGNTN